MLTLPNGDQREVVWYQFRLPINEPTTAIGGISDIRSSTFCTFILKTSLQKIPYFVLQV